MNKTEVYGIVTSLNEKHVVSVDMRHRVLFALMTCITKPEHPSFPEYQQHLKPLFEPATVAVFQSRGKLPAKLWIRSNLRALSYVVPSGSMSQVVPS